MKIYKEFDQRSDEWFKIRLGVFSPSRFGDLMSRGRTKSEEYGKSFYTLVDEKIAETLWARRKSITITPEMQRGIDLEPEAIKAYEQKTGNKVEQVAFVEYEPGVCGGSPDGLVGDDGIIEVKCPSDTTHLKNIKEGLHHNSYKYQIQGYLMITNRQWCDYISYSPDILYPHLVCVIQRVYRDEDVIDRIWNRVLDAYAKKQLWIENMLLKEGLLK